MIGVVLLATAAAALLLHRQRQTSIPYTATAVADDTLELTVVAYQGCDCGRQPYRYSGVLHYK